MKKLIFFTIVFVVAASYGIMAQNCVTCHKNITPNIVSDWELSKHSKNDVDCSECHGHQHNSSSNVDCGNPDT